MPSSWRPELHSTHLPIRPHVTRNDSFTVSEIQKGDLKIGVVRLLVVFSVTVDGNESVPFRSDV